MKKTFALVLGLFALLALFSLAICAQQANPQTNFPATVAAANPSLYLNFNDLTTGFTDKVSGAAFIGTHTTTTTSTIAAGSLPTVTTTGGTPRVYFVLPAFTASGTVQTISIQYETAPAAGQVVQLLVGTNNGGGSFTINSEPATITLAATTAVQTFTAGAGFTAFSVTSGQVLGVVVPSGATGIGYASGVGNNLYSLNSATVPAIGTPTTYALVASEDTIALSASFTTTTSTTYTSGTVTPRQPGFDSTTPNNTSAAFRYNAWNAAPNNTLGSLDWNIPFSILVHIDRLNWIRTGSLVLLSKGDLSSVANPAFQLVLQMNASDSYQSQLCFYEYGTNSPQGLCTGYIDAMPNGFNYDIAITNSGTGANGTATGSTNSVAMYINGLEVGGAGNYIPATNASTYGTGFGALSFTVSGGTGYAATTPVTITGGGPNCTVTNYEMLATSGVPTSIVGVNGTAGNYGCTSSPSSVTLTSPTGAGVALTATPNAAYATMNSTTYPLMIPGYVNSGVFYGVAGSNSAAASTYVDEAAIFPGVLTATQIGALFYQTKFYQGLLTKPAVPPAVVFDDDGATDMDNLWALQEALALHKLGYINLEGVVQENNDSPQTNLAFNRQQLDQAGLANVPVGLPSDAADYTSYNVSGINTFNASTLTSVTYPTAAQVYRQVFAANAGEPVSIMVGGELNGLANFMQSPADSISSLTGAQLFARNAANGGVLYSQGGTCTASALPATTPCTGNPGAQFTNTTSYADAAYVYANGQAMRMIAVGGTPAAAGPGPLVTRTSKDPTYLQMSLLYGTDQRTAWDSLPMSALVTPYFYGGVTVGYAGGTGYANSTLFTSTGGGPNCTVTGYMTASGGVPNGITTLWEAAAPLEDADGVVAGLGYGCTSAPTLTLVSPTGTGVTLTADATTVCGTASFPGYSTQSFASGTCSNQYVSSLSQWTLPESNAPVYRWFLNSLVDAPTGGVPRLK